MQLSGGLDEPVLEAFDFLFYRGGNAMLGQVYLGDCYAESFGDLRHGPLLEHVEVKHLELFGVDLSFDAGERRIRRTRSSCPTPTTTCR